jgi:hypothetical protein
MPAKKSKAHIARRPRPAGRSRKNAEHLGNSRENHDPFPRHEMPQPKETQNPPNENLQKHPDEVYGDTEIPGTHRR